MFKTPHHHHHHLLLLVVGLSTLGCDGDDDPSHASNRADLRLIGSEHDQSLTYLAFAAADDDECAAVVMDEGDAVLVIGPSTVVAGCSGDAECDLDVSAEQAIIESCGRAPELVAAQALATVRDDGLRLGEYCPPEYNSCDDEPGGGYGCLSTACKSFCGHELHACQSSCHGNAACLAECGAEARACFSDCC